MQGIRPGHAPPKITGRVRVTHMHLSRVGGCVAYVRQTIRIRADTGIRTILVRGYGVYVVPVRLIMKTERQIKNGSKSVVFRGNNS